MTTEKIIEAVTRNNAKIGTLILAFRGSRSPSWPPSGKL